MRKEELKNCRQFKEALKKSEIAIKNNSSYGYIHNVPTTWCVKYELSTLDLLVYCYIRDCTKNMREGAFTGSVKGLCAKFNTSLPTARKSLAKLTEKGFTRKEKSRRGESQWVRYVDNLMRWWIKEDERPLDEILQTCRMRNVAMKY